MPSFCVCEQDATVTHYTQYTVADLIDLTSRLNAMLAATPFKSLKTILLKYSHQYVQAFLHLLLCVIYMVSQKLLFLKEVKTPLYDDDGARSKTNVICVTTFRYSLQYSLRTSSTTFRISSINILSRVFVHYVFRCRACCQLFYIWWTLGI